MTKQDKLTIRSLRVRAVNVPMASPVETSGGKIQDVVGRKMTWVR